MSIVSGSQSVQGFFYWLCISVLSLEIREKDWNPINWFDPAPFLSMSQVKSWIYRRRKS
jgi:hypothetical protein